MLNICSTEVWRLPQRLHLSRLLQAAPPIWRADFCAYNANVARRAKCKQDSYNGGASKRGRNRIRLEKTAMDKKAKKKLDVIHQKLGVLRQALSGAKRQDDEPGEVQRLEREIASLEAQAEKLKAT
jgi:hypothetical protein